MLPYIILIIIHFIGDFVLQNDKMAVGKSSSNYWLSMHVAIYTSVLAAGLWVLPGIPGSGYYSHPGFLFVAINGGLHWITDYFTSRLNAWLFRKGQEKPDEVVLWNSWRHWFFTGIGADQVIHYTCLFLTYDYLKS